MHLIVFWLTNQISLKRFAPILVVAFMVVYACNSEMFSGSSLHAGVYTSVVVVVQATYARRCMYAWVATVVRKGEFPRNTSKVC